MTDRKEELLKWIGDIAGTDVCVAFSGGVDSSLLVKLLCMAAANGSKVHAVTFSTRLQPAEEIENAARVAQECGAQHHVLKLDERENQRIMDNPEDRCYWCKHFLFEELKKWGAARGVTVFIEGSNADDQKVYRPGLRAVRELGVHSPLMQFGITKAEVRALADELGLSVAKRPSAPCMATRLPYGARLDFEVLGRLEAGEEYFKQQGIANIRLRLHGDVLRIEADPECLEQFLRNRITYIEELKKLGFCYITLDLEGFRSGSMDVHINKNH